MTLPVHPILYEKASKVDFSRLNNDVIHTFQHKYEVILKLIFAIFILVALPTIVYRESILNTMIFALARIFLTQNTTAVVNSAAHMFGVKPYKMNIKSADNIHVAMITLGEGYHM